MIEVTLRNIHYSEKAKGLITQNMRANTLIILFLFFDILFVVFLSKVWAFCV